VITLNYGVAIILFTIFMKAILLPLTVKQQKSMVKTQKIQPLLMEIQQKYGNDKEKLNQETMKLYQKYKINPMSGCLPMLIQLPIIMALYFVVKEPIIYIMGVGKGDVWRLVFAIQDWSAANPDAFAQLLTSLKVDSLDALTNNNYKMFGMYEIQIARFLHENQEIMNSHWITETGQIYKVINFSFLGLDLSRTPDMGAILELITGNMSGIDSQTIALWSIPVLSGVSSFATSKISQATQPPAPPKKDEYGNEKPNPMKTMMIIMPFFSAWLAFTLPAAIGLYWTISNVLAIIQQIIVTKAVDVGITDEQIEGEIVNAKENRKKRKKRK
ncbi:MAG: YidC/Oxa1 family membrane protein insertase, partial [Oscillospiraceae bacterium]